MERHRRRRPARAVPAAIQEANGIRQVTRLSEPGVRAGRRLGLVAGQDFGHTGAP